MACATCVAAEALCREHTTGAAPWCLIQPHVAALFPPKKCCMLKSLAGVEVGSAQRPALDPLVLLQL